MRSLVACLASLAAIAVGVVAVEELKIEFIVTKQCDRKSKNGDTISVNYNGTLTNGEAFDSSELRQIPRRSSRCFGD